MFPPSQSLEIYSANLTSDDVKRTPEILPNGFPKMMGLVAKCISGFKYGYFGYVKFQGGGSLKIFKRLDDKTIYGSCAISFSGSFSKSWISLSTSTKCERTQHKKGEWWMVFGLIMLPHVTMFSKCFASKCYQFSRKPIPCSETLK